AAGTAQLTLTLTQAGCLPVTSNTTLTIDPTPIVSAGTPQTVCANNPAVSLNGSVTHATGLTWATLGDGTFNNINILNPVYTPGSGDIAAGTVVLTATSTGHGTCNPVTSPVTIT